MHATTTKPYNIDKKLVYDAYKAVKTNAGAAGVDKQTIEQFDANLMRNLYKFWNRMSSGSYFPPPVRAVPIPKKNGGQRILGVPTVAARVAQMVVKQVVEKVLEPVFMPDSYGYRPNKSALDAVGITRKTGHELLGVRPSRQQTVLQVRVFVMPGQRQRFWKRCVASRTGPTYLTR
jgi:RNA-directed DNA polymerase